MAEAIIKKRIKKYKEALEKARKFAYCVRRELDTNITAVLFGSYARGDFHEESDIDVLIVIEKDLPPIPHKRIDLILKCMKEYPEVEPVLLTLREFKEKYTYKNPLIVEAVEKGIVILDELGVEGKTSLRAHRRGRV